MAWYPDRLFLLRPRESDVSKQRPVEEHKLPDAWKLGTDELVLLHAKLRPALVVSTEKEHDLRKSVRLMPLYKVDDDKGFYSEHEIEIRRRDIPGLFWIDDVPIEGALEPRIVDCARVVRFPKKLLAGRERIAVLDTMSLFALKKHWSESVLV